MTMEGKKQKGPGSILRERRMVEGHDIAKAASFLGISVNLLTALECDDYDSPLLQNTKVVRSYLERYARFLELPQDDVYRISQSAVFMAREHQGQQNQPMNGVFRKVAWVMLVGLAFGVAELFYWGKHKVASMPAKTEIAERNLTQAKGDTIQEMVMQELQAEELERTAEADLSQGPH